MKSFMWVSHEIGDVGFYENEIWRKTTRVRVKLCGAQEEQVEKLYCIINDEADDVEHDS